MTRCAFDPSPLVGVPMGMFHCPGDERGPCGCMVIAGMEHGPCEDGCSMQDDADRAMWDDAYAAFDAFNREREQDDES